MADLATGRGDIWRFGPFLFNPAAFELTRNDESVSIEPQSLRLLDYLIRHRDRVVSREDLVDAIWQGRAISDWAISAAIKALRVSLSDQQKDRQYVRTVHSRGYRFVADVRIEGARAPVADEKDPPIVLVRLFRAPSGTTDTGYLADGLTDDLITSLSRQTGLRVLSYNASRAMAAGGPPANVAVDHIVDGSVRQLDETIRINVAILEPTGTQQIWAERFDLTRASLLAGHDRIGDRLVDVLLPGHESRRLVPRGTGNSAAYDAYLKGRYAYFRYEPAAFAEALTHFTQAAELDPGFADAYAQQAYCRTTLFVFGLPGADKTLDRAEALARKAIDLDGRSALGHARLGWVLGYLGQPEAVTAAFDMAIACDPHDPEVLLAYGETMNRLARPRRAEPLLQSAFAKDSYHPPSWEFPKGHTKVLLEDFDSAIAHFLSVLDRVDRFIPARVQLARAYWEAGQQDDAIKMVEEIRLRAPKYSLAHAERMFPYPVARERSRLLEALSGAGMPMVRHDP